MIRLLLDENILPALVRLPAEIDVYSQSVARISYNSVPFFSSDNVSAGGGFCSCLFFTLDHPSEKSLQTRGLLGELLGFCDHDRRSVTFLRTAHQLMNSTHDD